MREGSILAKAGVVASCAAGAFAQQRGVDRPVGGPYATRSVVMSTHAMAATSHPLATQIALDVMREGGSAVDAAIAANAALGLMEPTGCGVGGDLFALVWDPATKQLHGYNGSGRAPAGLTMEALRERGLNAVPRRGPLPVTVPGSVQGWCDLHERFGKVSMEAVLAPAIRAAREGFAVTPVIADGWATNLTVLREYPHVMDQFSIEGRAPRAGEIWRNPQLAGTLERIAKEGRDGFYRGRTAMTIARFLQAQGGVMSEEDLAMHAGEWVTPISTTYRGVRVFEIPPNGQGLAALQMLNVLEGLDVRAMGFGSVDHVHAFVEAKKLAFEDRARLYADQTFSPVPLERLLSKEYAAQRRGQFSMERAARRVEAGIEPPTGTDTIYLCTADASGMMVSLIQSNYRGMGSGMVPADGTETLGFMLQNRGEQFATVPGHANELKPGKRPFHTIIPAFLISEGEGEGAGMMAFGVMGGAMQPQGHAQIVMNIVDFGMDIQEAGDAPRIHHDGSTEPQGAAAQMQDGGVVNLESGFGAIVERELLRRGHRLERATTPVFGGYQAIWRDARTGVYHGASESRKDGQAAGY